MRTYELVQSIREGSTGRAADGLPVPPGRLIAAATGAPGTDWYVRSGQRGYDTIAAHVDVQQLQSVLDFGCGCGRVARYWSRYNGDFAGCDTNAAAVRWCQANLPVGRFAVNRLDPPLPYADGSFDFVYALSVLTHLTVERQRAWLDELRRVLRPAGQLMLTAHGDYYRQDLTPAEQAIYDTGEVVIRSAAAEGLNLCGAYHPPGSLARLATGFDQTTFVPSGALGNPAQDLYVLRRR